MVADRKRGWFASDDGCPILGDFRRYQEPNCLSVPPTHGTRSGWPTRGFTDGGDRRLIETQQRVAERARRRGEEDSEGDADDERDHPTTTAVPVDTRQRRQESKADEQQMRDWDRAAALLVPHERRSAGSHVFVENPRNLFGCVTVPERLRLGPFRIEVPDGMEDFLRVGPDEGVPTILQGLDPLRLVPKGDARHAEEIRLLLDPPAVRDDLRGPHQQRDEVQVVDWLDGLDLGREAVPQAEGDEVLAGPRMHREDDLLAGIHEGLDDGREGLLVVHVLGPVK